MESPLDEATITSAESMESEPDNRPADETLWDGYLPLQPKADPGTGHILTEAAESTVSERTKVKQKAGRRTILDPLRRRGHICYQ